METLEAARLQMAFSMIFHIIFACISMVMPFFMVVSHYKWLKTGNETYYKLTKVWQKGVAIFFVTGAVSGTILSFELGLLWPKFMLHAGPIIGMPFSLEGAAFFVEAIALGFYLYGWDNIKNKWFHWFTGTIVGISGVFSGILVVAANGWMNAPTGFDYVNGKYININPIKALFNDAWFSEGLHMILASFTATSFAVAGIHAFQVYRNINKEIHTKAFQIAIFFGAIAALLQPISGDISAKDLAKRQPLKLAAMEAHYNTEKGAPLYLGGIVDNEKQTISYKIELPKMLSFLAYDDFDAEVKGINDFPKEHRPPVAITHYAFQIMVGIGTFLAGLGILFLLSLKFKSLREKKGFWLLYAIATPLGFIALEAGWIVTEVGRQPWVIYNYMLTKDAVTPMPGIQFSLYLFILLYILLAVSVSWLLIRQINVFNQKEKKA